MRHHSALLRPPQLGPHEHDALTRRVSEFDRYIDNALAPYAKQCRQSGDDPGIDRTSAWVILIETGPDVAVVGAARTCADACGMLRMMSLGAHQRSCEAADERS